MGFFLRHPCESRGLRLGRDGPGSYLRHTREPSNLRLGGANRIRHPCEKLVLVLRHEGRGLWLGRDGPGSYLRHPRESRGLRLGGDGPGSYLRHTRGQQPDGWAVQIKFVTPAKAGAYGWAGMGRVLIFVTPARSATDGWAVQIKFVTPAKNGWVGMGRVLIFVTPANPRLGGGLRLGGRCRAGSQRFDIHTPIPYHHPIPQLSARPTPLPTEKGDVPHAHPKPHPTGPCTPF